jgi:hypothetical protein
MPNDHEECENQQNVCIGEMGCGILLYCTNYNVPHTRRLLLTQIELQFYILLHDITAFFLWAHMQTHTHTSTHTQRERKKERERDVRR